MTTTWDDDGPASQGKIITAILRGDQEQLLALGMWPGVRRCEGGWCLTVDPDTAGQRPRRATGMVDE